MLGFGPLTSTPIASIGGAAGQYFPLPAAAIFRGSNVLPNQFQVASGHLLFGGATPVAILAPPRVTWIGVEALHTGLAFARVSWIAVEVLRSVLTRPTQSQVTWMGAEVVHDGAAFDRVTWIGVEVLRSIRSADSGWISLITG